jgi:glycosyltransferase involved in cell wall biosynthesis
MIMDHRTHSSTGISVILPAYNHAKYVTRAVESVLNQTYTNLELVVVDDGSTDDTPEVLARIHHPAMRVVRKQNGGLSAARNTGLKETTAPLVTFLDADDYFLPEKLEVLSRYMEQHPDVGLAAGIAMFIDGAGNRIAAPCTLPSPMHLPELLFENPVCVSGILMRRPWLERVGVFDESLRACEDYDLWLRLAAAGCRMDWVDYPVVAYRVHPGQMTSQAGRMRTAMFAMLDKFFASPQVPAQAARFRDSAYAAAFVHSACFAYLSNDCAAGSRDIAEAAALDPSFKVDRFRKLVDFLVSWANDPRSEDPAAFLQRVMSSCPPGLHGLEAQLRRASSDALMAPLFRQSRETRRTHRANLAKAILYKPDWLLNRGVLRMVADSWLTFR